MKKLLLLLIGVSSLAVRANADTIAWWTFESPNIPPTVVGSSITGLLPSVGSGTASGVHANAATTFSTAVGNGSANALSANNWTVGDYWQFRVSTTGFKDIQLSFAQRGDSTGPTNFNLAFSLDGANFTTALSFYTVRADNSGGGWSAGSPNAVTVRSVDLTSYSQLNNASDVYFRLTSNIFGPAASTGRIDDFQVTATAIPEPTHLLLPGLAVLAFCRRFRR